MRQLRMLLVVVTAVFFLPTAMAASPAGNWVTKGGRALVKLNSSGNGYIVRVLKKKSTDTGKCTKCRGKLKNRPVKGLTIVTGMKKTGPNEWSGGKILDAENGKYYRCKMTLKGNRLYVRGYIGVSLLGRTQTWVRR